MRFDPDKSGDYKEYEEEKDEAPISCDVCL